MRNTKDTDPNTAHRAISFPAKLDLALTRFHRNLRLIALGAPHIVIVDSQRLIDRSVAEIGLSEADLAKLYPTFRIVALVRDALAAKEAENDGFDDCHDYKPYDDDDEADLTAITED